MFRSADLTRLFCSLGLKSIFMYGSRAAVRGGHKVRVGTKFGIAAFALAVGTTVLWFYFVRQVNLPEDRTGFVVAFLAAASLGVLAYIKGTGWIGGSSKYVCNAVMYAWYLSYTVNSCSLGIWRQNSTFLYTFMDLTIFLCMIDIQLQYKRCNISF